MVPWHSKYNDKQKPKTIITYSIVVCILLLPKSWYWTLPSNILFLTIWKIDATSERYFSIRKIFLINKIVFPISSIYYSLIYPLFTRCWCPFCQLGLGCSFLFWWYIGVTSLNRIAWHGVTLKLTKSLFHIIDPCTHEKKGHQYEINSLGWFSVGRFDYNVA